jgi:transcriptional regulator with XRE-family HTH domain
MRVAELAREVGVTPSLISQIERGQSRPSVSTLFALAQALGVPVDAFFREGGTDFRAGDRDGDSPAQSPGESADVEPPGLALPTPSEGRYVVRRGTRAVIDIEGGVRWERLTPETLRHLDFFELVYAPGAESNPTLYSHPGTELLLITSGVLQITVGFDSYLLEPGDSMQFPSSMPHKYLNPAAQTARAVTVILYDCPDDATQSPPHSGAR